MTTIKKTCVNILILLALVGALCLSFAACDKAPVQYSLDYDASEYAVGAKFEARDVQALDIEWLSGNVYLDCAEEDTELLSVTETGATDRGDSLTMHTQLKDGVLSVKCAAPGSYELGGNMVKTLRVRVPDGLCLERTVVHGYATTVDMRNVMSRHVDVRTHSGAVAMETAATNMSTYPREIALETFSGGVWLNVTHPVAVGDEEEGRVRVRSSSGNLTVKINAIVPMLDLRTSSGHMDVELNSSVFGEVNLTTLSGGVDLVARVSPLKMNVQSKYSILNFKLNGDDAFELVTDAQLAVSMVDISKREPLENGEYKYLYQPADYSGSARREYYVKGEKSVLRLEKITLFGE